MFVALVWIVGAAAYLIVGAEIALWAFESAGRPIDRGLVVAGMLFGVPIAVVVTVKTLFRL